VNYCIQHSMSVCLSVFPVAYLKSSVHVARGASLWWQCNTFCTSVFCGWHMFSHNGTSGTESNTTLCLFEMARWQHWRRSLMPTIALFVLCL